MSGSLRLLRLTAAATFLLVVPLVAPMTIASASSGKIIRGEANSSWTLASITGSATWGGCEYGGGSPPSLVAPSGCTLQPYVTVGTSECSASQRQWPHSTEKLALAWSGAEYSSGGSQSFSVSEVPLSGEPGQLACLTLIETYEARPYCQLHPEPGVACPMFIIDVQNPVVLDKAPLATAVFEGPPMIESESVSNVTSTDATLEADIDTGGLATEYRFLLAYGCGFLGEACPQFCIYEQPCPGPWSSINNVPLPSGDISGPSGVQHVSLDLNSVGVTLEPYKYRYSIEATNREGTAEGAAQYFTPGLTPLPPAPPADPEPPQSDGGPLSPFDRASGDSVTQPLPEPTAVSLSRHLHRRHHKLRHKRRSHRSGR